MGQLARNLRQVIDNIAISQVDAIQEREDGEQKRIISQLEPDFLKKTAMI